MLDDVNFWLGHARFYHQCTNFSASVTETVCFISFYNQQVFLLEIISILLVRLGLKAERIEYYL